MNLKQNIIFFSIWFIAKKRSTISKSKLQNISKSSQDLDLISGTGHRCCSLFSIIILISCCISVIWFSRIKYRDLTIEKKYFLVFCLLIEHKFCVFSAQQSILTILEQTCDGLWHMILLCKC